MVNLSKKEMKFKKLDKEISGYGDTEMEVENRENDTLWQNKNIGIETKIMNIQSNGATNTTIYRNKRTTS